MRESLGRSFLSARMAPARPRPGMLVACLLVACAGPALRIDADRATGFALYRSGWLSEQELGELCAAGVSEMVVLDGTAGTRECRLRERVCPHLRVRWNERQSADRPLDAAFLAAVDAWVDEARAAGRKIAFRCHYGWHRTGRLAAYYALRHQGWSATAARREMHRLGRFMEQHPTLDAQVEALADHLAGRLCAQPAESCVPAGAQAIGRPTPFPADVCATGDGG